MNTQNTQQLRGRSSSRKSNPRSRAQSSVKPMKKTYVAALASSPTNPTLIRNINIVGNDDKVAEVRTSLLTNTAITENGITAVKCKGKNNFTVFFNDEIGAQKTEDMLKTHYDNNIVIKSVTPVKPMIKITGLYTILSTSDDVIDELRRQNHWMKDLTFVNVRDYTVKTDSGSYMNIIISCDLLVQEIFLHKGSCIFGLNSCKNFEYVDVLRCNC